MKKIIVILFLAALTAGEVFSDSNPHDSLLFDGESSVRTETVYSTTISECEIKVTYILGNATGMIKKKKIYTECGSDTVIEYENGNLEKDCIIKGGEEVKTGPGTTARMEFSNGDVIVLGPNSSYKFPDDVCEVTRNGFLNSGSVWTKIKKMIGGGKFQISTERACACVRGTEFSVEIKEENGVKYDIIKVYESSVEVSLIKINTSETENNLDALSKLNEDFQSGKITQDEYNKRSLELTQSLQSGSTNLTLSKIVETGYMLKTDGKVLVDPVPFNTSDDTWFKINE
jgi:hypothetical protein